MIGVFFFSSLIDYSSVSELRGSKMASKIGSSFLIVKALIWASSLVLVTVRVFIFERYKPRDSRSRAIVVF